MRTTLAMILGLVLSTSAFAEDNGRTRPDSGSRTESSRWDDDRDRDDDHDHDRDRDDDRDRDWDGDRDDWRDRDNDHRDWDRDRDDWRGHDSSRAHFVYRDARPYDHRWRPDYRRGFTWVPAHWERGVYVYGYWEPISPRYGYVWVRGYWNGYEYIDGYWRLAHRPGYRWIDGGHHHGRYVEGSWVRVSYYNHHR